MNRPRGRQIWEGASPLALSQRLAVATSLLRNQGAVGGKAAEGCRSYGAWERSGCSLL
jgi:hypothetical protein